MGKIIMENSLKITLATGNINKVKEINLIAKDYNIEFVLPKGEFNPIEDGSDFIENAYCKASFAAKTAPDDTTHTNLYLADDSGLCVKALDGAPGIHSARYAPTADERIEKLLANMKGIKDREAFFTCAMVVVDRNGKILYKTQDYCKGTILEQRRGQNGFGYDPIFFVTSINKGMAELTKEEKSKISHRAKALNNVLNWMKTNLNDTKKDIKGDKI